MLDRIGFFNLSLCAFSAFVDNKLPSGPIKHSKDIITSSLIESIAGFVTCAKSCLK